MTRFVKRHSLGGGGGAESSIIMFDETLEVGLNMFDETLEIGLTQYLGRGTIGKPMVSLKE